MQSAFNGTPDEVIGRINKRVERINKLAHWQACLLVELGEARAELAAARDLAAVYQRAAGINPVDLPPPALADAWNVPNTDPRPVAVEIDGIEVTLIVTGAGRSNLAREYRDWQSIKETHRRVRHDVGEAS